MSLQLNEETFLPIIEKCIEHIFLSGTASLGAVLLGVPLGILTWKSALLKTPLLLVVGVLQTIPSLALLAFLLSFLGIGAAPALVALFLYALLPIVRNTVVGLEGVSEEVREAADALGFTPFQKLRKVELPLALPVIAAGLRTSAVMSVGIATLAAFIGAGGLGDFINRGLALNNTPLIFKGAVPAALLAVFVDLILGFIERLISLRQLRRASIGILLLCIVIAASSWTTLRSTLSGKEVIRVGTKNFTEQFILGELIAQTIEQKTSLKVERKFNLGSVTICHNALINNEIDIYPEYSGTALTVILKDPIIQDADKVVTTVREAYRKRFNLEWLSPFGFNNTFALAVREELAQRYNLTSISDLAGYSPSLTIGFPSEFWGREDGFPGLSKQYGLTFNHVQELDPGLMYRAIAEKQVDVISAFSTDGRILAYNLKTLTDDKQFFPPYNAAPVIRASTLNEHPELITVLSMLKGILSDDTMRHLNFLVDERKQTPEEVARSFLRDQRIIN